jgi:hypothetical protein
MSVELVRSIKADLEARDVDLSGPCGAFQITKRIAWALRETGAGLHAKPYGNNCDGYSVDIVIWPDGKYFDCLQDAGGLNGPIWGEHQGDAQFYRPAIDPGDAPQPEPLPPPVVDLSAVLAAIAALSAKVDLILTTERVCEVLPPTFPDYSGRLFGYPVTLRPKS